MREKNPLPFGRGWREVPSEGLNLDDLGAN
jgi:hypothetical protein